MNNKIYLQKISFKKSKNENIPHITKEDFKRSREFCDAADFLISIKRTTE